MSQTFNLTLRIKVKAENKEAAETFGESLLTALASIEDVHGRGTFSNEGTWDVGVFLRDHEYNAAPVGTKVAAENGSEDSTHGYFTKQPNGLWRSSKIGSEHGLSVPRKVIE